MKKLEKMTSKKCPPFFLVRILYGKFHLKSIKRLETLIFPKYQRKLSEFGLLGKLKNLKT